MWRLTLFANVSMMTLSWILGLIILAIPHNHLIQYGEGQILLPQLTYLALLWRWWFALLPGCWLGLILVFWQRLAKAKKETRTEWLQAFSMLTATIGLGFICFCSLAAVLPYLYITSPP